MSPTEGICSLCQIDSFSTNVYNLLEIILVMPIFVLKFYFAYLIVSLVVDHSKKEKKVYSL